MSYSTDYLGKDVKVVIDRPFGSIHPNNPEIKYTVNYGYIPDTIAPDGKEIDVYILGVEEPLKFFEGKCIAVIHRTNDKDDKLIVTPEGKIFTDEDIKKLTIFQEKYFESMIIK